MENKDRKLTELERLKLIELVISNDGLYGLVEYVNKLRDNDEEVEVSYVENEIKPSLESTPKVVYDDIRRVEPKVVENDNTVISDDFGLKEDNEFLFDGSEIYAKSSLPYVKEDLLTHGKRNIQKETDAKVLVLKPESRHNMWADTEDIKTVSPGQLKL